MYSPNEVRRIVKLARFMSADAAMAQIERERQWESQQRPVEVFPPGDFIREELEERSWTQEVLAEVLGTSLRLVNEIITGRRAITPATARALGEAFDTGPTVWMNLESAYRLSQVKPRVTEETP